MSIWTHAAGVIRIDAFRIGDETNAQIKRELTNLIGKELSFYDSDRKWNDRERHPEKYLPCGSEGSLHLSIWINPNKSSLAAFTVTIFGDLRDYDSANEIILWFQNKIKEIREHYMVRQATITAETEGIDTKSWTFSLNEIRKNKNGS